MTPEEIIAMAKETIGDYSANDYWPFFTEELQKFAAQVAAKRNEENAQLCESVAKQWEFHLVAPSAALQCAAAIRARGTKEGV